MATKHHCDPEYTGEECPRCGHWTVDLDEDDFCDNCRQEPDNSILKRLFDNNIVSFNLEGNEVDIYEECDTYYHMALNKEEFKQLIDELEEIYNQINQ